MSYANLPVMWMFSGRNNIFLWATGWEFSTFNLFHRHVARIATLQAAIHSIAWTAIELKCEYNPVFPRSLELELTSWNPAGKAFYANDWKQEYWYMGGMVSIAPIFLNYRFDVVRQ